MKQTLFLLFISVSILATNSCQESTESFSDMHYEIDLIDEPELKSGNGKALVQDMKEYWKKVYDLTYNNGNIIEDEKEMEAIELKIKSPFNLPVETMLAHYQITDSLDRVKVLELMYECIKVFDLNIKRHKPIENLQDN
jgi:hypothetical protein